MSTYKIKMSKEERYSIYATIALIVVGYALAFTLCNPSLFARFGAIVVCVGVFFSLKGLPQILEAIQPIFQSEISELNQAVEQVLEANPDNHKLRSDMEKKVKPQIAELENKLDRSLFAVKKRFLQLEGGIVIVGTLIWGFGDYLVLCSGQNCF